MANGVYKREGSKYWWGRVKRKGRQYRQSLKTTSRPVADKRYREWVDRIDAADWGGDKSYTYDEAMYHFMSAHVPTLKPTSQRRYRVSARMLTPHFEGKGLHEITSATMAEFEAYRRRDGASNPTIRRDFACLSSMLETAICDWNLEAHNPVPGYLKKRARRGLKESPPRTRYLSHQEEAALLANAAEYLRPMIAFAIDTGLRLEEQLSLTWPDVDRERGEIVVRNTKNGRERRVPLQPRGAQIVSQCVQHLREPHYLFRKEDGTRYHKLTRGLAGAATRAGISDLKWHDLRRTCGCRLLQDYDMSMAQVRDWLGHSSITVTERSYAFLTVDSLHEGIKRGTKKVTGHAD